jgi:hypothetical protein
MGGRPPLPSYFLYCRIACGILLRPLLVAAAVLVSVTRCSSLPSCPCRQPVQRNAHEGHSSARGAQRQLVSVQATRGIYISAMIALLLDDIKYA